MRTGPGRVVVDESGGHCFADLDAGPRLQPWTARRQLGCRLQALGRDHHIAAEHQLARLACTLPGDGVYLAHPVAEVDHLRP